MDGYSDTQLVVDSVGDEMLTLYSLELRVVVVLADCCETFVQLLTAAPLGDLTQFAGHQEPEYALQKTMVQTFTRHHTQLLNAAFVMLRVRLRFKTLGELDELKEVFLELNERVGQLLSGAALWITQFMTQFVARNNAAHRSALRGVNVEGLLPQLLVVVGGFKLVKRMVGFCPLVLEAEGLKDFYRVVSEFNSKFADDIDLLALVVHQASPVYLEYEMLRRTRRQQMTFEEYQQELRIVARGDYKEDLKKASKRLVNKNLMMLLHTATEVQPFTERVNDQVLWVLKSYYLSVSKLRADHQLSYQNGGAADNDTNVDLGEFLQEVGELVATVEQLNLLLVQMYHDDFAANVKDYLRKARYLVSLLSLTQPVCDLVIHVNGVYNKLMKLYSLQLQGDRALGGQTLVFRNVYVYLIFDQQYSNFNNIMKKMMDVVKANQDPTKSAESLDKLIKNEYAVTELYTLGKELLLLGSCIDVNQLNNRKVVIDEVV